MSIFPARVRPLGSLIRRQVSISSSSLRQQPTFRAIWEVREVRRFREKGRQEGREEGREEGRQEVLPSW